jgi:hypothetical protein
LRAGISVFVLFAFLAGCTGSNGTLPAITGTNAGAALGKVATVPVVGSCKIFPTPPPSGPSGNDWWNVDISKYPLDPNSATYIKSLPGNLHPDFGQNPTYGIPFVVVPANQKLVPVKFVNYPSSSNPGPYPIPPNAPIEGGKNSTGDRHVLVMQLGTCKLFEMWRAFPPKPGRSNWTAANGAVFVLSSNKLRPNGWTSADAAGLPIFPALVKCAEVAAGAINHPLRVTFNNTQNGYIHPATHEAGSADKTLPPMGLRLRLKASFDISHYNKTARIILTAMKTYGMFVADNGSNWYFQGEGTGNRPKSCWNDNELNQLKNVPGSAFEAVATGPILH